MIVITLLVFIAGLACGLALRPGLDRRRQLRRVYAVARERRRNGAPPPDLDDAPFAPRDYYQADRRQRGTLAEDFGLKRRAEDHGDESGAGLQAELDLPPVPMPRDYYERADHDDEGTLSESYGLRGPSPARGSGPA